MRKDDGSSAAPALSSEQRALEIMRLSYHRVVCPQEDGTFFAQVLEFPGCMATGDTEAEALSQLTDVTESWLLAVIEQGQSIPDPVEDIWPAPVSQATRRGTNVQAAEEPK